MKKHNTCGDIDDLRGDPQDPDLERRQTLQLIAAVAALGTGLGVHLPVALAAGPVPQRPIPDGKGRTLGRPGASQMKPIPARPGASQAKPIPARPGAMQFKNRQGAVQDDGQHGDGFNPETIGDDGQSNRPVTPGVEPQRLGPQGREFRMEERKQGVPSSRMGKVESSPR